MADAIADQIVDKFVALLDAITATSTWVTVKRDRQSDPFNENELPAVSVELGSSTPLGEFGPKSLGFLDSILVVSVVFYSKTNQIKPTKEMLAMYKEAYIELMKDHTLGGLSQKLIPDGWEPPLVDETSEESVGALETMWRVEYRHNYKDPSI